MHQSRRLPIPNAIVLTAASLLAACGGASTDSPPPQTLNLHGDGPPSFWSGIGLGILDEEHIITGIAPGRKCWSATVERSPAHFGGCGTSRVRLINEDVGTVRAVKQSGGPWPLTLIVEHEGQEKGRATTTEPSGSVEVEGSTQGPSGVSAATSGRSVAASGKKTPLSHLSGCSSAKRSASPPQRRRAPLRDTWGTQAGPNAKRNPHLAAAARSRPLLVRDD
jgi:hypothetical protein